MTGLVVSAGPIVSVTITARVGREPVMPIQLSELMLYLLPGAGSMLLVYGIFQAVTEARGSGKKKLQDRLKGDGTAKPDKVMKNILRRGGLSKQTSLADHVFGKLSIVPRVQRILDQADLPWSASQVLMNLGLTAVVLAAGLMLLQIHPIIALACSVAVFLMPLTVINFIRRRRMSKLTNQLPDVFEMMSQALRAGHSLASAMQLVHEQLPPPIATEFGQVYYEQNLGVKIEDALQAMAQRVESLDVKFFVTAVMIQRQTGGDLAEVLDKIGDVIRQRIELRGMVQGLTAEGRLSGWVLFALPIVVFIGSMYLNPKYASMLIEDPRGKLMLAIAAGMQVMGLAMIRWIVNIKI